MIRKSYPQGFYYQVNVEDGNVRKQKWEDIYRRIQLQRRRFPDYSIDKILDKYTEDWKEKNKFDFIQWFKMKNQGGDKLYKEFKKEYKMEKYAATIDLGNDEQLKQLRKKFRSRVDSAGKVLNQIHDEGLLGNSTESSKKVQYLSNVLQTLKNEILTLKRPELVVARLKRASKFFRKAGIEESASILDIKMRRKVVIAAPVANILPQLEMIRDVLVKETKILSFDRIKILTKIIDFFDNHNLAYSDPLKKAINTLMKPLDSASNDIYEVISAVNRLIDSGKTEKKQEQKKALI